MNKLLLPVFASVLSACALTHELDLGLGAVQSARRPAPPSPDFVEDHLDDMSVSVPDGRVEVCVWDDQCQDGDAIRVSIDGSSYDVVLENDPDCRLFDLAPGQHQVGLLALNGTGFQGNCSHTDENTGAITVGPAGQLANHQTWAHRGGTGSRATLWVTVD